MSKNFTSRCQILLHPEVKNLDSNSMQLITIRELRYSCVWIHSEKRKPTLGFALVLQPPLIALHRMLVPSLWKKPAWLDVALTPFRLWLNAVSDVYRLLRHTTAASHPAPVAPYGRPFPLAIICAFLFRLLPVSYTTGARDSL